MIYVFKDFKHVAIFNNLDSEKSTKVSEIWYFCGSTDGNKQADLDFKVSWIILLIFNLASEVFISFFVKRKIKRKLLL